jgi:hypothetical protein
MKLNRVKVKNCLCFKEVDIPLDSKLNIFAGPNKAGKTSLLRILEVGLEGTTNPDFIRRGEDEGYIFIDTDEIDIERTVTREKDNPKAKSKVVIKNKEGWKKAGALQTYLSELIGDNSFAPFAFIQMKDAEQAKYLQDIFKTKVTKEELSFIPDVELLTRLNFEGDGLLILKTLEDYYYTERTKINKTVDQKKALYETTMPAGYNAKEPEYDLAGMRLEEGALLGKINEARGEIKAAERNKVVVEGIQKRVAELQKILDEEIDEAEIAHIVAYEEAILSLEVQMKEIAAKLTDKRTRLTRAKLFLSVREETKKQIKENQESIKTFEAKDLPNIEALDVEITSLRVNIEIAQGQEEKRQKYLEALEIKKEWDAASEKSKSYTKVIEKLRNELPAKIMNAANIPIAGLRFDENGVKVNDVPVSLMSTSEQVELVLSICRARNKGKKLKVLFVDRAESLDKDTMAEFKRQIKPDNFQYLLTFVTQGDYFPEGSMLVENGEVKA